MIQIIDRVFKILEYISQNDKSQLKNIAEATGLKKSTLSNILRSLTDAGALNKVEGNKYQTGPRLEEIIKPRMNRGKLIDIADDIVQMFTEEVNESALVSVLYNGDRYIIANSSASRSVTVHYNFEKRPTIYETATGRILLAFADINTRKQIISSRGLPHNKWNGIDSIKKLKEALAIIKRDQLEILVSEDGEAISIAAPAFFEDGTTAAIGCQIPAHRFTGKYKINIEKKIKFFAGRMTDAIKLSGINY